MSLADVLEQRHAIHAAHSQVGDHQMWNGNRQLCQGALGAVGTFDAIACSLQAEGQQLNEVNVVVDN